MPLAMMEVLTTLSLDFECLPFSTHLEPMASQLFVLQYLLAATLLPGNYNEPNAAQAHLLLVGASLVLFVLSQREHVVHD
jgi:hypothetical protein